MNSLPSMMLTAKYPCCKGKCRIKALVDVPRETYDRQCPRCDQKYSVDRMGRGTHNNVRIDVLTFVKA